MNNLQDKIIHKIQHTSNNELLLYINSLLDKENVTPYQLTDFELQLIKESEQDYKKGQIIDNGEVFNKIDKWLEEE